MTYRNAKRIIIAKDFASDLAIALGLAVLALGLAVTL